MVDGSKTGSGFKLCTHSFTKDDVEYLASVLYNIYNLKCSVQVAGEAKEQFVIWAESMDKFRSIVTPFFHPSMLYKLT
jgi:LAGLIDADG DNA endonuclease family